MDLERIVKVAYNIGYEISLPVRLADKGVKLGFDVVLDYTGIDRFKAARYVSRATSLVLIASSPGYTFSEVSTLGYVASSFSAIAFFLSFKGVDKARNYFTKSDKVLEENYETTLAMSRIMRTLFLAAIPYAVVRGSGAEGFFGTITPILGTTGLSGLSSTLYLLDGDHSLWDKAKKKAADLVNNLRLTSPSPDKGLAINYNAS